MKQTTEDEVLVADQVYAQTSAGMRIDTGRPAPSRRLPIRSMMVIAGCLVWVLSPIDVMPEAALGPFGLGDDVVALLVMGRTALSLFRGSGGRSASKK